MTHPHKSFNNNHANNLFFLPSTLNITEVDTHHSRKRRQIICCCQIAFAGSRILEKSLLKNSIILHYLSDIIRLHRSATHKTGDLNINHRPRQNTYVMVTVTSHSLSPSLSSALTKLQCLSRPLDFSMSMNSIRFDDYDAI